ncbi:MAG: hypothetical protein K8I82_31330 [Anaerolineae bacterium]|nr:hypothetical protein [Anaerolineae bacterium]
MKTERLVQFALKQTAIIIAVIAAVPLIAGISTLLLATISSLFSEQLHGLMILSVVATATTLAVKEFRRDTNR